MTKITPSPQNTPSPILPADISIIHAFAQICATVIDLEDLLTSATDLLMQTFNFDICMILLVDDQTDELQPKAYEGHYPIDILEDLLPTINHVLEKETLIKETVLLTSQTPTVEENCLTTPLTVGRLTIGLLILGTPNAAVFSFQNEQLLTIFSSQLTAAITNAQFYRRNREQQQQEAIRRQIATHLQKLSTIINATLDMNDVLNLILEHIAIVIPYSSGLIMLLQGHKLEIHATSGANENIIGAMVSAADTAFYQHVLLQQYPAVFNDMTNHKIWHAKDIPFMENTKAWIGAPLVIKNRIIGMLTMHHTEAGYFDDADLDLVHTFANQAAIAIDNAQIYTREQQKVKQFQTVAKIGRQATEIHEVQRLLDTAVQRLHQDLGYEFVSVFLLHPHSDSLQLKATTDDSENGIKVNVTNLPLQGQGIISTAARTGEPLLVNDVRAFPGYITGPGREQVYAELAIPLRTQEILIGVLDIQSKKQHAFSPDDLTLAQTVADQIAVAIKTANLFEERDQHLAELIAFNQIGSAISDLTNLDKTLLNILQRIKALYQVEGASVLELNKDKLHFRVALGTYADTLKQFTLDIGEGFAGWVVKHKQSLRVNNVDADERHFNAVDKIINFKTRSLLAVPIQIQNRILGVVEIVNCLDGRGFTQEDEMILSFITSAMAITMENSRLFGELTQKANQMASLLEASQLLTNLNLDEVLHTMVTQVVNLLKSQWATVYQIDPSQDLAISGPSFGMEDIEIPTHTFQLEEGTVGWVIKHQTALRIDNVNEDNRFVSLPYYPTEVETLLCVPLIAANRVIGVLQTINKQNNQPFTAKDEVLMNALVSQAAIAIHNAQIFQNSLKREEFALDLGKASLFINKSLDLDDVLKGICRESINLFGCDSISVWRLKDEFLHCIASDGLDTENLLNAAISPYQNNFLICQAFNTGQPVYKNNQHDTTRYLPDFTPPAETFSIMAIPLLNKTVSVGALLLVKVNLSDYFTGESLSKAIIYSNQVTIAIENAYLHQQTERRLTEVSALYTLAHHLASNLDVNRLLEDTTKVIRLALDSLGCSIFLLEKKILILGAQNGDLSLEGQRLISKLVQQIITTGNPINYPKITDLGDDLSTPSDVNSLLMVPLRTQGKLSGALTVYDKNSHAFGPNEGRLLTIVATQIAASIENSKLFKDLQQHAQNLEHALSQLQNLHHTQNEFVQNISHELRTPLTFIQSYIDLILEDSLGQIPEAVKKSLSIVSQRTTDLGRLINDIITHQQLELHTLKFKVCDLAKLINLTAESARPFAHKNNISLIVNIPPNLPEITADQNRLRQVFDNLIGNAIKFTKGDDKIIISAQQETDKIKVSIKDTGIGIRKDDLDKIFNRFYQVDGSTTHKFSGTGLGLTIVKQIIEAHQGKIWVASELNQGSEFIFTLPLTQPSEVN